MKALIRLCFRRPVTVGAACALAVALAAVAVLRLPVALLPDLGYPALTVWTAYPDVPPERVERAVTEPVEEAVAGTEGLERITARSQLGGSLVELRFGWNTDLDLVLLSVREQIDRLGNALPEAAEEPVVLRVDPSERPIMLLALRRAHNDRRTRNDTTRTAGASGAPQVSIPLQRSGQGNLQPHPDRQDLAQLRQVGEEVIARRLEQLRGVARVRVTGGQERQVDVRLDPDRMARYQLAVEDIARALRQANATLPSGTIRRGPFRFAVEVTSEFEAVDDIGATVLRRAGATSVRLRDVAEVRMGVAERRGLVRYNGREALLMLVERRPGANTVEAASDVRAALAPLEAELAGVDLDVVVDESVFIEEAIGGVVQAVGLGGLLAVVVLLVFLRRRRPLVAVAVAVPLSLGLTLAAFEAMGVTFNLIALSGLALGVGLLVDNAIVVVENITRLREEGLDPVAAARQGAEEVAGAITASTLTTAAVFLPLTFVEGLAGRLFRDQSLAVVAALGASLLVALTVVPLLLRSERGAERGGESESFTEEGSGPARQVPWMARYERGLRWSLDHPGRVLGAAAALVVGAAVLAWTLPREVVPEADQGRVTVQMTMDPGTDLPLLSTRAATLEAAARRAGATHVLSDLGERSTARLELDPRPPYEADLTVVLPGSVSADAATRRLQSAPAPSDVRMQVEPAETQLEALLARGGRDLQIDLVLRERPAESSGTAGRAGPSLPGGVVDTLLRRLQGEPALAGVRRAEAETVPAVRLLLKREAMARFGVRPPDVATYLEAAARGRHATDLRQVSEEVPIVLRAQETSSVEALLERRIPTPTGPKPLRVFVEAEPAELPAALLRAGQAPVVRLVADIAPGAGLAEATRAVRASFDAGLPPGVRGVVSGANQAFQEGLRAVGWSLLLSLLVVYLILTAQFERLLQPLVILATVPLAASGVATVLWLTGQSVNLMSLTGCVVLVGIVVNDAIIKVDVINQRRAAGLSLRAAIEAAGRDRARPILMTTITTALGLLPLALGLGAGAEIRAPLAIAITGGLCGATVLTLFVVPVLVQLVSRETQER